MQIERLIIEVLRRHSSKDVTATTHPLKRTEIVKYLKEEFPEVEKEHAERVKGHERPSAAFSEKRVRTALDSLIEQEDSLYEHERIIHYTVRADGSKSDYYLKNALSDEELAFLIDSVMYGDIFGSVTAQQFAKRIQSLSGKNLKNLTRYADGTFGKQKYQLPMNVMNNIGLINQAMQKRRKISFFLNVYDEQKGKVILRTADSCKMGPCIVTPHKMVLYNGRYYLLANYKGKTDIYYFRVDLLTDITITKELADKEHDIPLFKTNFERAQFIISHPYMQGGELERFTVKIDHTYFTKAMDDFSSLAEIMPGLSTEDTITIKVKATKRGMRYWLLQHADIATAVNLKPDFKEEMQTAVKELYEKYCK